MSEWEETEYDFSASRLKTHASCPKQYELKYIQGLEPTKGKSGYGELGTWVHLALERVLRREKAKFNQNTIHSKLKQEFFSIEDNEEVDTAVIDDDQRETGLNCLNVASRFIAAKQPKTRALEKTVNFHIDNPTIDKTAYGKIDVVTKDGQIWDWKTGSINDNYTPRDELIQGSVYMAGYHNIYDELPSAIRFVYLKEEKERELEPTEDSWQDMLQYARKLVQDESTGEFEAEPEPGKCYFCGFEMSCPASKVGIGGVNEQIDNGEVGMWDAV